MIYIRIFCIAFTLIIIFIAQSSDQFLWSDDLFRHCLNQDLLDLTIKQDYAYFMLWRKS